MKIWPSDNFEIETEMTTSEIVTALTSETEPYKFLRWSKGRKYFEGQFSTGGFKLHPNIIFNNDHLFRPVIVGTFLPTVTGTKIKVEMRLNRFTSLSLYLMPFFFLRGVLSERHEATVIGIITIMCVFLFLVITNFRRAVKRAKLHIIEMFTLHKDQPTLG